MAPSVEVDLTKATPPKKMKQARLPFAPVQNQTVKDSESSRKRKLSEEELITPNKNPKKADDSPVKSSKENVGTGSSECTSVKLSECNSSSQKSRSAKKKVVSKSSKDNSMAPADQSEKFNDLLENPLKENGIVVDKNISILPEEIKDDAEDTSMTSMTEEWAKFHENSGQCESDMLNDSSSVDHANSSKKTSSKGKAKSAGKKTKSKRKDIQSKDQIITKDDVEIIDVVMSPVLKMPPDSISNPLAKFLVGAKDDQIKKHEGLDVIESSKDNSASEKSEAPSVKNIQQPATSTPLRKSPRKIMKGNTLVTTPDLDNVHKMKVAKLKVKISELNIEMDKAVELKDFLKAHEVKQEIQNLENMVKDAEADTSYVSQSILDECKTPSDSPAVTPKTNASGKKSRNASVVSTPGSAKTPPMFKKLTPGQLAKQEELKKKREAMEKEKQAKKEALEKEKQAKKDAVEKEKQAKKEAAEKEKAEKERMKEVEKRAKEVEKLEKERLKKAEKEKQEAEKEKLRKEKEEERQKKKAEKEAEMKQKEEDRIRKEEEKRQLEEAEKEKIKKKAEAFKSFFKKDDGPKERKQSGLEADHSPDSALGNFTLFTVKKNMRLAPLVRNDPELAKKRIDNLDMPSGPDGLYLALLKTNYIPGRQTKTWPFEKNVQEDDDIEILDEDSDSEEDVSDGNEEVVIKGPESDTKIPKAKLLQFHENQRPAYWGTWTKKTSSVSGRRPFGKDEEVFEYDYDSDEDWEEEEEGESLSDNEDDKEEEKDDYEVDNEFFVPHGYLSDEEEEKDEDEVFNPETAKEKLKHAEKEFEKEHKKKTQQLKPRLWGVNFEGDLLDTEVAACQLVKILGGFRGIIVGNNNMIETSFSKPVSSPSAVHEETTESASVKSSVKGAKARLVPEEAIPDLIQLLHGNTNNKIFLAREFIAFWKSKSGDEVSVDSKVEGTPGTKDGSQFSISKRKMIDKIQEVAEYKKLTDNGLKAWWVKQDILSKYNIDPTNINEWKYVLEQPNSKNSANDDLNSSRPGSPSSKVSASPNPASLITKFARVLTEEEKEEQKAKQEKEALLARLKREAAKAEQISKDNKAKTEQVLVQEKPTTPAVISGVMDKFTKVLTNEEHKAMLTKVASPSTGKKRIALTPVAVHSPVVSKKANSAQRKKNPIAAISADPDLATPKTVKDATPIAVKRSSSTKRSESVNPKELKVSTPQVINAKASPIPIRRTPKTASKLDFKGTIGSGVSITPVRSSPRKKNVECVTID